MGRDLEAEPERPREFVGHHQSLRRLSALDQGGMVSPSSARLVLVDSPSIARLFQRGIFPIVVKRKRAVSPREGLTARRAERSSCARVESSQEKEGVL